MLPTISLLIDNTISYWQMRRKRLKPLPRKRSAGRPGRCPAGTSCPGHPGQASVDRHVVKRSSSSQDQFHAEDSFSVLSREIPMRHRFYVAGKAFRVCRGAGPLQKSHLAKQSSAVHHAFPQTQRREVKTCQPRLLFSPGTALLQRRHNAGEK